MVVDQIIEGLNEDELKEFNEINEFFKLKLIHMYFISQGCKYPPLMKYNESDFDKNNDGEYIEYVMDKFNSYMSCIKNRYEVDIEIIDDLDLSVDLINKFDGGRYLLDYDHKNNELHVEIVNEDDGSSKIFYTDIY